MAIKLNVLVPITDAGFGGVFWPSLLLLLSEQFHGLYNFKFYFLYRFDVIKFMSVIIGLLDRMLDIFRSVLISVSLVFVS